jgi:hypothetical protein
MLGPNILGAAAAKGGSTLERVDANKIAAQRAMLLDYTQAATNARIRMPSRRNDRSW